MIDLFLGLVIGFVFGALLSFIWGFIGAWKEDVNERSKNT